MEINVILTNEECLNLRVFFRFVNTVLAYDLTMKSANLTTLSYLYCSNMLFSITHNHVPCQMEHTFNYLRIPRYLVFYVNSIGDFPLCHRLWSSSIISLILPLFLQL